MAQDSKVSNEGLLILTSLAEGPKHGYAIQQDIEAISGRHLGPGSLYGAIARLEVAAYIESLADEGPRRPYRLTAAGSRALTAEIETLTKVAATGRRRLATR